MRRPLLLAAAVAVASLASAPDLARAGGAAPTADEDSADARARELFRTGQYADALAIYARLRAETHHPTYLRNIGRCHQMLRQPDQAIASFQAYLSAAGDLPAQERAEIQGYIAEMEGLRAAAASPPPAPRRELARAPAPPAAEGAVTDAQIGRPPKRSVARSWWLWAGLGALAGVLAAALIVGRDDERLPCPPGAICRP